MLLQRVFALGWVAAALAAAGCNVSFPDEFLIEDLRVLDIQTDPPEVPVFSEGTAIGRDGSVTNFGLDTRRVRYDVLVAHPDLDAVFEYRWFGCAPALGSIPCGPAEPAADGMPRSNIIDLDNRVAQTSSTTSSPVKVITDRLLADAVPPYDFMALTSSLARTLARDPRDLLNGLYAHANVLVKVGDAAVAVDTPELEATKRVVVYDPTLIRVVLAEVSAISPDQLQQVAGLDLPSLCVGASTGQLAGIFEFLEGRAPNVAPVYESVEWTRLEAGSETSTSTYDGTAIVMAPGQQIRLNGVVPDGTAQKYQVIDANCELQTFGERYAFSWFINAGELSRQLTTEQSEFVTYTAPLASDLVATKTRVRIWSVLRDGRGGSARRIVEVSVEK